MRLATNVRAELKMSNIFSNNMVLQRNIPLPVWGWASPGEKITVNFQGQEKSTVTGSDGKWMLRLNPLTTSSKPDRLTVTTTNGKKKFHNVLVGDVWLCSGQSNMGETFAYPLSSKYPPGPEIARELKVIDNPQIRLIGGLGKVVPIANDPPVFPYSGWQICHRKTAKHFSRAGYYFGAKLQQILQVPIGLVNVSYGCSSIEAWMPPESFTAKDEWKSNLAELRKMQKFYREYDHCSVAKKERAFMEHCRSRYGTFARKYLKDGKPIPENYPVYFNHIFAVKSSGLYLHAIRSIIPFGIKGVIWYQGETNAAHGDKQYAQKQQVLIESWRKLWGQGDFPFYLVQVAPFNEYLPLTSFWLQQYEAVRKTPNTGLISAVDINNINECHPKNKRDVGLRLALLALRNTYGKKDLVASGPTYKSVKIKNNKIAVTFDQVGSGLTTKDGKAPDWFEIAGANQVFRPAQAVIKGQTVEIRSPEVKNPKYVRFAWNYLAEPNSRNKEGLPIFPFNTAEPFFQRIK